MNMGPLHRIGSRGQSRFSDAKDFMFRRYSSQYVSSLFILIAAFGYADIASCATGPTITSASPLTTATEYTPYSYTLTCSTGGGGPYKWSVLSGSLPSGLSLSSNGIISGTPVVSGTSASFTISVTDGANKTGAKSFRITITPACAFTGTNIGSITFGNIDPSTSPGPITNNSVTQQVSFRCDATLSYTISKNPANPSLVSGANSIPFTLGLAATGQNITNTAQIPIFTTTSSIAPANYQNAPSGSYNSGNISLTISWSGASSGSISATATATGNVIKTCIVSQSAGTLTFNIDPSLSGTTPASISQDLIIRCTKGSVVSVSASSKCGGATPRLDSLYSACGGAQIPYTFTILGSTTGKGFGSGYDLPLGIGGSASSVNYADAPVGSYGDLQTITISY